MKRRDENGRDVVKRVEKGGNSEECVSGRGKIKGKCYQYWRK